MTNHVYNSLKRRVEKVVKENSFGDSDKLLIEITNRRDTAFEEKRFSDSYAFESLAVGLIVSGLIYSNNKTPRPVLATTIGLGSSLMANMYFKEKQQRQREKFYKNWFKKQKDDWKHWRQLFQNMSEEEWQNWKEEIRKQYSIPDKPGFFKPKPGPKQQQHIDSSDEHYTTFISLCENYGTMWYTILGVEPDSDKREIEQAFRLLAVNGPFRHPDKGGDENAFRCLLAARDYGLYYNGL